MIKRDSISREEIFICMKKWERAEITCLDIAETSHKVRFEFSLDGGYLGDGKLSGWFGKPDPAPSSNPTPAPAPAPAPEVTPDPVDDVINRIS